MPALPRFLFGFSLCLVLAVGSYCTAAEPNEEVAKLIVQLKNPDETVRLKVAKEIAKHKANAKPAVELLAKIASSDPDEDVRNVAKRSLNTIREAVAVVDKEAGKEAVAPYLKALKSKKAAERVAALEELGKLGDKARPATSEIAEAMLDAAPTVRDAAIAAMELVDPTIHKHLICLLYDNERNNHVDSFAQLEKMGNRAKGALPILKRVYSSNSARYKQPDVAALKALVAIAPDDALIVNEV